MRSTERKHPVHWAWYILSASFLTAVVSYGIRFGYGIILPQMIESLRLSKTKGGLIYSIFLLMYTLFSPFVGNLTDRIGARKVITFFCGVLTIGVFLMSTANHLITAILFLAIAGCGISSTWTPVVDLLQRWFTARRRGFALGVIASGAHLGYGTLGLIFPLVLARHSWRFGWLVLGVSALAIVVINGLVIRDKPEDLGVLPCGEEGEESSDQRAQVPPNYLEIFKRKQFWQIGLSYFFISFCYYTFIAFLVTYGTIELGIDYGTAATFASVFAFGAMAGAVSIAALSDIFGRKRTMILCEVIIGLSVFSLIAARSNLWIIFVSIAIYGVFFGPIFPLYGACSRDYFEEKVTGTIVGTWTFIYGVGAVTAPLLVGSLADVTGTFRWGFCVAGMASLLATALLLPVKSPGKK